MKIHLIGAARPNFMKIAPLYHELKKENSLDIKLIHTGQHYDKNMSESFFIDLNLPKPDFYLGIGGGNHSEQVGKTMIEYEKICVEDKPDLVIVVGDVNATMACSIAAKKLGLKVAHLEAGIRSFDMTMPEEINRRVTDSIVDYYWTPSVDANENLVREGVDSNKIELVGNIMIDSFEMKKNEISSSKFLDDLGLKKKEFVVATFHRPSNVDSEEKLDQLIKVLKDVSSSFKIVIPLHPRTKSNLERYDKYEFLESLTNILIVEPLSYINFMSLVVNAKLVLTDSGGVQEETTYLNIPCLTFRDNTERPITVKDGSNTLVNFDNYKRYYSEVLNGVYKTSKIPVLWDGKTSSRILEFILNRGKQ